MFGRAGAMREKKKYIYLQLGRIFRAHYVRSRSSNWFGAEFDPLTASFIIILLI